jgi:hypothetical protein
MSGETVTMTQTIIRLSEKASQVFSRMESLEQDHSTIASKESGCQQARFRIRPSHVCRFVVFSKLGIAYHEHYKLCVCVT